MIIQRIIGGGNKAGKCLVMFEDGTNVNVSSAQIADFGLYPGLVLTDNEYSKLLNGIEVSSAKARAIRILGNRSLSASEVKKRLIRNGGSDEAAAETVAWLEETGLVDDAHYAGAIVRHYCAKGYGPAKLKGELHRRGIPRELWDEHLGKLDGECFEPAIDSFLEKKLKGSKQQADLRRAADALKRRGHAYEQIREAIDRYLENNEEESEV